MAISDPSPQETVGSSAAPSSLRIGLLDAARRSVSVVVIPVVILVAGAAVLGLLRRPTYTSQAQLNVGGLNLSQTSIEGYTTAVQYLAIGYAQTIHADGVVGPAAGQLGVPRNTVIDDVGAAAIPGSPVITVTAKSHDGTLARHLADAASNALVTYAVQLNLTGNSSQTFLSQFRQASQALQSAQARLARTAPHTAQQRAAETAVDVARLRVTTTTFLYQQSQAGQVSENLVQKLAPAGNPKSDRFPVLWRYVGGGLLGGLLIGFGLALERANRLALRRIRSVGRPAHGRWRVGA